MGLTLSSRGRGCESLVMASQTLVCLDPVPRGIRYLPGGKAVPAASLVDFVGIVRDSGRLVCLDAKECHVKTRFPVGNADHVSPKQIEFLCRYGRLGALAGLLIESTAHARLHWLPWRMLDPLPASYPWEEVPEIGSTAFTVNWNLVMEVDRAGKERNP